MRIKILLTLCTFILLASCSSEQPSQDVIFVTLTENAEFLEVQRVPLVIGQSYGWVLKVKDQNAVAWKEEFTLPSAPKVWGEEKATSNINIITKSEQPVKSDVFGEEYYGFVSNVWSVAEGDPAGIYNFKISSSNGLVKEFNIEFYKQ